MRKITEQSIKAFLNFEKFKKSNTEVRVNGKECTLLLHGNKIAKVVNGELIITNSGWFSNTTKERLNGIPGVSIYQENWKWFLNGVRWDGNWIEIK